jgi:hypothetical protein
MHAWASSTTARESTVLLGMTMTVDGAAPSAAKSGRRITLYELWTTWHAEAASSPRSLMALQCLKGLLGRARLLCFGSGSDLPIGNVEHCIGWNRAAAER